MNPSNHEDLGLRAQWTLLRNRVLSSPRFQRFAARFALTRPVARRRARGLFDLVAGFTYSQILAACVDAGLFELLRAAPLTPATIAAQLDLSEAATLTLLRAAEALGLVERLGERWALGSQGAALLGNGGVAEMIAHHRLLYADLGDPMALLRRGGGGGELARLWRYSAAPPADAVGLIAAYSALMAASQPLVAEQAIAAYPFRRHRRLLDVGGGEGAFLAAVAARVPAIELALFDLPAVCERAAVRLGQAGLLGRAKLFPGDFLRDPLPRGHDCIALVRVLHDHDDDAAMALLRAAHDALVPGGTLFIAEPMAGTRGAEPAGAAYFGFYLLAMGSGRPRRPDEIAAMLRAAGFAWPRLRWTAMPLTARVMTATKR